MTIYEKQRQDRRKYFRDVLYRFVGAIYPYNINCMPAFSLFTMNIASVAAAWILDDLHVTIWGETTERARARRTQYDSSFWGNETEVIVS